MPDATLFDDNILLVSFWEIVFHAELKYRQKITLVFLEIALMEGSI